MPASSNIRIARQTIAETTYLAATGKASLTEMKVRDEKTNVPNKMCATAPAAVNQDKAWKRKRKRKVADFCPI
jgi:hypothetical protein